MMMKTGRPRKTSLVLLGLLAAPAFWAASAAPQDLQIRAAVPYPDKSWASPVLDSRLVQLAEIERTQGLEAAARFAAANAVRLRGDGKVDLLLHSDGPRSTRGERAVVERLAAFGGEVRGRAGSAIEAWVPIDSVEPLAGPREITWIEPAPQPAPAEVTSQGVATTRANQLLQSAAAYRASDAPVRVGVLDVGFEGYERLLGSELPAQVTVRSFHPNGIAGDGPHGTACAEIVHDMAPEAELFLASFDSVASHGEAVDWLIAQRVDVISYSIGWYNLLGPGDGRGVINDHVRRALAAGIEWVGAAGNAAEDHWEGTFSDPDGNGLHNYTATDEGNSVSLRAGEVLLVLLSWDDWFQSDQDYDLYILDTRTGRTVAFSINSQTGSQPPTELAGVIAPAPGTYEVAIYRSKASREVRLEAFFVIFGQGRMQYVVPEGSLEVPADTDGAIAVGAHYWGTNQRESYSSQGPTTDGRTKPDISGPTDVDTSTYMALGRGFTGTSAATPHVAGAIALLKARFGIFTLDQVVEILYGRAIDRGPAGKDNQYGEGTLDVIG